MKLTSITKRTLLVGAAVAVASIVVVACGGGGDSNDEDVTPTSIEQKSVALSADKERAKLSWTPPLVVTPIWPGQTTTTTVTFKANQSIPSSTLWVAPEIARYVSVSPATLGPLSSGQAVQMTLTFTAKMDARAAIATGTVQVRAPGVTDAAAQRNPLAQPLPVLVAVLPAERINGIAVPPEPSPAANNATLSGIDLNGNGVRDDVERVLASQFGRSPSVAAFMRFAIAEQQVLLTGSSAAIAASDSAYLCNGLLSKDTDVLTNALLNTAQRKQKYKYVMANAPAVSLRAVMGGCQ